MKMIYIATTVHGRGITEISAFEGRLGLWAYADDVLCTHNTDPKRSDSIDTLCEKLYDNGPGFGSRSHRRVSYANALGHIRDGVRNNTFL
jgi:hypothetical protein